MSKKYIIKNGTAVEVSDEIYKILRKWDRRITYVEHDLKETRYIINQKKQTVKEIPSREDSLDRLTTLGFDFADQSADFRESVTDKIMLEKNGFVNCDICIMSDDVADVFVNSEEVKSLLDIKAYDLAVIKPKELPSGVTYIGTIQGLGLDLYTYNEWYLDDWTDPEKPENTPVHIMNRSQTHSIMRVYLYP